MSHKAFIDSFKENSEEMITISKASLDDLNDLLSASNLELKQAKERNETLTTIKSTLEQRIIKLDRDVDTLERNSVIDNATIKNLNDDNKRLGLCNSNICDELMQAREFHKATLDELKESRKECNEIKAQLKSVIDLCSKHFDVKVSR